MSQELRELIKELTEEFKSNKSVITEDLATILKHGLKLSEIESNNDIKTKIENHFTSIGKLFNDHTSKKYNEFLTYVDRILESINSVIITLSSADGYLFEIITKLIDLILNTLDDSGYDKPEEIMTISTITSTLVKIKLMISEILEAEDIIEESKKEIIVGLVNSARLFIKFNN